MKYCWKFTLFTLCFTPCFYYFGEKWPPIPPFNVLHHIIFQDCFFELHMYFQLENWFILTLIGSRLLQLASEETRVICQLIENRLIVILLFFLCIAVVHIKWSTLHQNLQKSALIFCVNYTTEMVRFLCYLCAWSVLKRDNLGFGRPVIGQTDRN